MLSFWAEFQLRSMLWAFGPTFFKASLSMASGSAALGVRQVPITDSSDQHEPHQAQPRPGARAGGQLGVLGAAALGLDPAVDAGLLLGHRHGAAPSRYELHATGPGGAMLEFLHQEFDPWFVASPVRLCWQS